jgi:imidazolonepropionase-like amidohydrolase
MNTHILSVAVAAAIALPLASQDVVAVKAGKIHTITGPTLDNGVILIQNGRITKVAKATEVEIPWTAKVVDASDKVVLPTWVLAHTQGGGRGMNENMQNVPWLSVADALDPSNVFFEESLRNGVGTIHVLPGNQTLLGGQGLVVRPYGRTVEDMAVGGNTGIKMSLLSSGGGRLQQIRRMRRAIEDIRDYIADFDRRKAEFEKEKAAGAVAKDKEWTEEYDRTKKPSIALVQKKAKGWLFVPSAAELDEAMRLGQELDLVYLLGQDIDEGVAALAKLGVPVVLDENIEYVEKDPETGVETRHCPAKQLADAGVPFAITLATGGPGSYPWWQLGTCVRNGIDRNKALEALTTVPAKLLGLDDQIGSIAEGKLGNLQVLSGDPLQATSWVETVILEGQIVYERSKDPRLALLFAEPAKQDDKAGEPKAGDKPAEGEQPKGGANKTEGGNQNSEGK